MIKPLTSLRAFFALFVFFSHLYFWEDLTGIYKSIYIEIFHEGFLGVSFFFILSGFVLSFAYNERIMNRKISFSEYFVARIARIYPLHLFTLIIALPFTLVKMFHGEFLIESLKITLNGLLLQSWVPKSEFYFSLNAPSWSISNEFFFYTLFPFLVLLFKTPQNRWLGGINNTYYCIYIAGKLKTPFNLH